MKTEYLRTIEDWSRLVRAASKVSDQLAGLKDEFDAVPHGDVAIEDMLEHLSAVVGYLEVVATSIREVATELGAGTAHLSFRD